MLVCLLPACKGPNSAFNINHVGKELWQNEAVLSDLDGGSLKVQKIKRVLVYRAYFKEIMTEQNGVSNYQVVNTRSRAYTDQHYKIAGYSHELYLLVFDIDPAEKPSPAIYFSATYDKNDTCIGIDPLYIGELTDRNMEGDVFQAYRELKIKDRDGHFELVRKKGKAAAVDIRFVASDGLLKAVPAQNFSFTEIAESNTMIAGRDKKLIFHPMTILGDSVALYFEHVKTITP